MDLIAIGTVKHNGKWFNDGDSLKKIKKEDGERLIELGVAKVDELSERIKAEEEAKKKAEDAAKKKAEEQAKKEAEEKAKIEAEKKKESESK